MRKGSGKKGRIMPFLRYADVLSCFLTEKCTGCSGDTPLGRKGNV